MKRGVLERCLSVWLNGRFFFTGGIYGREGVYIILYQGAAARSNEVVKRSSDVVNSGCRGRGAVEQYDERMDYVKIELIDFYFVHRLHTAKEPPSE